jgi:hypothetical protein
LLKRLKQNQFNKNKFEDLAWEKEWFKVKAENAFPFLFPNSRIPKLCYWQAGGL